MPALKRTALHAQHVALEKNHIICNYQTTPREEGFTAAAFQSLALLMADVILKQKEERAEVMALRKKYREMQFCFFGDDLSPLMAELHNLI